MRHFTPLPTAQLGKWCACAVLLLVPGTLLALPLIWLFRRWRPSAGG